MGYNLNKMQKYYESIAFNKKLPLDKRVKAANKAIDLEFPNKYRINFKEKGYLNSLFEDLDKIYKKYPNNDYVKKQSKKLKNIRLLIADQDDIHELKLRNEFSNESKIQYFSKRVNDETLSFGQRSYAKKRLKDLKK